MHVNEVAQVECSVSFVQSKTSFRARFLRQCFGTPQQVSDGLPRACSDEENWCFVTCAKLKRKRSPGLTYYLFHSPVQKTDWVDEQSICNGKLVR